MRSLPWVEGHDGGAVVECEVLLEIAAAVGCCGGRGGWEVAKAPFAITVEDI